MLALECCMESNFAQVARDTHFISCGFGSITDFCTRDYPRTVHVFFGLNKEKKRREKKLNACIRTLK